MVLGMSWAEQRLGMGKETSEGLESLSMSSCCKPVVLCQEG